MGRKLLQHRSICMNESSKILSANHLSGFKSHDPHGVGLVAQNAHDRDSGNCLDECVSCGIVVWLMLKR